MKKNIYIIGFIIFTTLNVFADTEPSKCVFSKCTPSFSSETSYQPGTYSTYNDLTRAIGGFENEYSKKILLRGIVLDKECIPIANAKIYLWQKDEYGDYRYNKKFAPVYEKYKMNYKMYSEFKGEGIAYSDNQGQFSFVTVAPLSGRANQDSGVINFLARIKGFPVFETQIKLHKKVTKKEVGDPKILGARFNQDASVFYNQDVYDFSVVMDGENKHIRY